MSNKPTLTLEQLPTIDKARQQSLDKVKPLERKLYSREVMDEFFDTPKEDTFINERLELSLLRVKFETAAIDKIAVRLQALEKDLHKGIEDLDKAIQNVDSTVGVIKAIQNLAGILARILVIF